ncbi:hypothetical protein [Novipirellula aureliae]|uniref:hypothetical protein n=1 Tax=Novipirellula aureliae TaxID=2527966 RepID=UPI0018CD02D8|nr:hypothetical protein [Novipirellula aureliae]
MKHSSVELVSAEETSGGYKPHTRKKFTPQAGGRHILAGGVSHRNGWQPNR